MNRSFSTSRIVQLAVCSRILVFCLQLISTHLIPQHENDGFKFDHGNTTENFLDGWVSFLFGGYLSWDGQYFMHIAKYGYTDKNNIVFFPLFPKLVWIIAQPLASILPVTFVSAATVVGFAVNFYCFVDAAKILYRLARFMDFRRKSVANMSVILFCFNPASIFFSAFYTESMFACLTFRCLLYLLNKKPKQALSLAAVSALCRSNGMLNIAFCLAFGLSDGLKSLKEITGRLATGGWIIKLICNNIFLIAGLLPFVGFQIFCHYWFCDTGIESDVLPGFCTSILPYQYIQLANWNVGFLNYFEWKQLPNFLLAAPAILTLGSYSFHKLNVVIRTAFSKREFYDISPEFIMNGHGLFLAIFGFTSMHVQVSTRLILSSCPYLYVFLARSVRLEICKLRMGLKSTARYSLFLYGWFFMYFLLGCLAFPAGYPWT